MWMNCKNVVKKSIATWHTPVTPLLKHVKCSQTLGNRKSTAVGGGCKEGNGKLLPMNSAFTLRDLLSNHGLSAPTGLDSKFRTIDFLNTFLNFIFWEFHIWVLNICFTLSTPSPSPNSSFMSHIFPSQIHVFYYYCCFVFILLSPVRVACMHVAVGLTTWT